LASLSIAKGRSVKQLCIAEPGRIDVAEVAEPVPGPGEVLLQLHSVGICGGDVSLYTGMNAIARYPVVPGHECVAEVLSAPRGSALRPGGHVVVYPTLSCRECRACRAGDANRCVRMTVLGLSAPGGCCAERFTVPEDHCVALPAGMADRFGALVEPVAVGCHVVDRGGVEPGDTALVIGSGSIGIATALVARARGVARVLLADVRESRREPAARCGFTDFTTAREAALADWVRALVGQVDLVYDTVTVNATVAVGAEVLAGGGRHVAIASAKPGHRVELPYGHFYGRELSFVACRNYRRDDFHAAIRLIEEGTVDPRPLRTGVYALPEAEAALAELVARPERHTKVLLTRGELIGSGPLLTAGHHEP
jgi:2-desacetyl-2-hydroxyethyl bacteriochlorophyllide A dehydrogenase